MGLFIRFIKKKQKKNLTFWDVGCANGSLIVFKKKFSKLEIIGSDIKKSLIKKSQKMTERKSYLTILKIKNLKLKLIFFMLLVSTHVLMT